MEESQKPIMVPLGYSHALKPGKHENSDPIVTIDGMDVPAEFCTRATLVDASPAFKPCRLTKKEWNSMLFVASKKHG
jgi:hypothetical protein